MNQFKKTFILYELFQVPEISTRLDGKAVQTILG